MPRANRGPRLALKQPRGYRKPVYFVRWYERGRKCERSTGTDVLAEAEAALQEFLAQKPIRPQGARDPTAALIADCLAIYADEHAPDTADPARIGNCIDALLDFWGAERVAAVRSTACKRYRRERGRADGTVRRELSCLSAALRYCVQEGYLTAAPAVWLPDKPPARDRWLTRKEAAALIGAARTEPQARFHLPLFILIGLYTGARRTAILELRWTQNTVGGWVDLERGRIDFNPVGRPQTKKRRPIVPIPDRLMRFLRLARARATTDHVIQIDGRPVASIKKSLATAAQRAGLKGVSAHVLRHTAITWLMQRRVPPWEVAGFVGLTMSVIESTYGHHAPDYLETARRAAGAASPLHPR